ncbi:hypothetical protein KKE19_02475 [Patescibacteria group bacterium]|nr:hypothetical protein [Patescibacteria group bacterium]MBU4367701.1 hypothetical protein [Patescibacteria group bacterium]MBU4461849.1 hypothetical protein [Patescibacteria group bacterium]MCG2700020.1 hypothetical protein [Candidatus Parcubacteria bacterium]
MKQVFKIYKLTEEERIFFKKEENSFWKRWNLHYQTPLYKRIAVALQSLAVAKFVGRGYKGINIKNEKEAIKHHLKACKYDSSTTNRCSFFRKQVGLSILNK